MQKHHKNDFLAKPKPNDIMLDTRWLGPPTEMKIGTAASSVTTQNAITVASDKIYRIPSTALPMNQNIP
jgi:hypothetical protein